MNLLWLYIFVYKNNNPQANTFFFNLHIYFIQAHYHCGLLQINTGNTFSRASIRCLSNLFSVLNLWKKNRIQTIRLKKKVNAFILYHYFCQFSGVFIAVRMQYFLMKLQKLITRISKKNSKFLFTRCKNKLQLTQFNNFLADNSLINVTIKTPYKLNFTLSSIWSSFSLLFRAVYSFSILKRHEKYIQIIKMTNINTCIRFKFSLIIMWCCIYV